MIQLSGLDSPGTGEVSRAQSSGDSKSCDICGRRSKRSERLCLDTVAERTLRYHLEAEEDAFHWQRKTVHTDLCASRRDDFDATLRRGGRQLPHLRFFRCWAYTFYGTRTAIQPLR